jgi:uncharacterized membrane protein YhaH (DUF805 family)
MNVYLSVLKKYAEFTGRATRTEYWMFTLFSLIVSVVLTVLDGVIGTAGALAGLYALATLLPSLGVLVRRLHDTGRSGWWFLVTFVPLVGFIVLIVFLVQDSQTAPNQYGPNPKGVLA